MHIIAQSRTTACMVYMAVMQFHSTHQPFASWFLLLKFFACSALITHLSVVKFYTQFELTANTERRYSQAFHKVI